MESQIATSHLPEATRTKAARIFGATKWVFRIISIIAVALVLPTVKPISEWLQNALLLIAFFAAFELDEVVALRVLRKLDLEHAFQRRRVINRAVSEPQLVIEADEAELELSGLRQNLHRFGTPVFVVSWAIFCGVLQFGRAGFESWETTQTYALASLIPAAIITMVFSHLTQEPILRGSNSEDPLQYDKFMKTVLWSKVAQVEQVQLWNFKKYCAECRFILRDNSGRTLRKFTVPPYKADQIFIQIKARLTAQNADISRFPKLSSDARF